MFEYKYVSNNDNVDESAFEQRMNSIHIRETNTLTGPSRIIHEDGINGCRSGKLCISIACTKVRRHFCNGVIKGYE